MTETKKTPLEAFTSAQAFKAVTAAVTRDAGPLGIIYGITRKKASPAAGGFTDATYEATYSFGPEDRIITRYYEAWLRRGRLQILTWTTISE